MSRVTILDLVSDYKDADIDMSTCKKSRDIQVIPRRIVELIMGKCIEIEWAYGGDMNDEPVQFGKNCAASDILEYAKSLLEQFEEDENDK